MIVNPDRLEIVKTIDVPGSECGGNCHSFGITIHSEFNLLAIAAQSSSSGGESKVMMFKINGNLSNLSGINIQHYYTFPQLLIPPGSSKPDVRGVVFCGQRFAYADYNGAIHNFRLPSSRLYHGWNSGRPVPDGYSRKDWYLYRIRNVLRGHQYYIGCAPDGSKFVIERTSLSVSLNAVGAVPSDYDIGSFNILNEATIRAEPSDWTKQGYDGKSRMNRLKGIAMDNMGNLFYLAEKVYDNGVSGVYMKLHNGINIAINELDRNRHGGGMVVDEIGFLYWVQNDPSGTQCLYKDRYIYRIAHVIG